MTESFEEKKDRFESHEQDEEIRENITVFWESLQTSIASFVKKPEFEGLQMPIEGTNPKVSKSSLVSSIIFTEKIKSVTSGEDVGKLAATPEEIKQVCVKINALSDEQILANIEYLQHIKSNQNKRKTL